MATLNVKDFPDELYARLRQRARRQRRSVAQEVITILEAAVAEPEPVSLLALRGLGKEYWQGVDPAHHVAAERESWES
ncbi:MAG: hypothetical protein HRF46_13960 [Acidobacteriota bacterium]